MSEIKVDTIGPRVDNGTLTIGASGDTVNIAGTAGTGFPAGTALTGSTNNTVTTVTGASAIQGEANLTFDGSNLNVTGQVNPTGDIDLDNNQAYRSAGEALLARYSPIIELGSGQANDYLKLKAGGAEQVRIHTNGVMSASDGVALGVGTANTASNVLDDYEEGSFTPTWAVSSGAIAQPNSNDARYTKVGNKVTIQFATDEISQTSTMGAAAYYKMTNLPFTVQTNTAGSGGIKEVGQTGRGFILWAGGNSTTANMYRTDTVVLPNAYLQGSFTYIAN